MIKICFWLPADNVVFPISPSSVRLRYDTAIAFERNDHCIRGVVVYRNPVQFKIEGQSRRSQTSQNSRLEKFSRLCDYKTKGSFITPRSFISGLQPSFSANPSYRSLHFFFRTGSADSLDCLPILLSISVFLLFSFSLLNFF